MTYIVAAMLSDSLSQGIIPRLDIVIMKPLSETIFEIVYKEENQPVTLSNLNRFRVLARDYESEGDG